MCYFVIILEIKLYSEFKAQSSRIYVAGATRGFWRNILVSVQDVFNRYVYGKSLGCEKCTPDFRSEV